jgi:cob(I)alamin adenosyltransferase
MAKIKLFISSPGDPSVGLWGTYSEVDIDDNVVWSHGMIDELKEFLAGLYDTKKELVVTERENILAIIEEEKREIHYIEAELCDGTEEEEFDRLKRKISNKEKHIKKLEKKLLDGGLI